MKLTYSLPAESLQDLVHINQGVFYPLNGFMTSADYCSVVSQMRMRNGQIWTIPITLSVDEKIYNKAKQAERLYLMMGTSEVGYVQIEDCFRVNAGEDARQIFGTSDIKHPGAAKESIRSAFRVGGKTVVTDKNILEGALNPEKTRDLFSKRGWKTIAAFHTRNPVHRAHEHLQRIALELCDGLFINPFLGWKKEGDFTDEAIMRGYQALIDNYYPKERVYMEGFRSSMRYAGPMEAVFHALIRKNLGCTHIIVGRDHAGVGDYYGKYEAQEFCKKVSSENNIGIDFLLFKEPYFCTKCNEVVSEKNCGHGTEYKISISGTEIRRKLVQNERPDERFLRPEVADELIALGDRKFIGKK